MNSLILTLLIFTSPILAKAGPGTDGGGRGYASTPADVAELAGKIRNDILFGLISEAQTRQLLNPKYVNDSDVKKVLEAMFGPDGKSSGVGLLNDAMQSSYVSRPRCPAFDKSDADASTAYRKGAPICYSTKLLKRYPKEELNIEMASLAMHELAHHFGFDEDTANKFQNYMRGFVRDFLQFGKLVVRSPKLQYRELRPGGFLQLHTSSAHVHFFCLKSDSSVDLKMDDATIVTPGSWIVKGSGDQLIAVSCRDYPTIDCADYLYLDPHKPGFTLQDAQDAGICKGSARQDATREPGTGSIDENGNVSDVR